MPDGNTLFERAQLFGSIPATIHAGFPDHELVIRTLAWSGDEVGLMPRPENFADLEQHLFMRKRMSSLQHLVSMNRLLVKRVFQNSVSDSKHFWNVRRQKPSMGRQPHESCSFHLFQMKMCLVYLPLIKNNEHIARYTSVMKEVAAEQHVGFIDVDTPMRSVLSRTGNLTRNGCHLTEEGYSTFAGTFFESVLGVLQTALRNHCVLLLLIWSDSFSDDIDL